MATMLRLEKYGRIDFSLGRWTTTDQNAPKSMRAHVKLSGELAKTKIRSLSRPQQPLFQRSSFRLHQNGVNLADYITNFTKKNAINVDSNGPIASRMNRNDPPG